MNVNNPRPLIRALLIDLSGNLHVGSTPTPNAVNALQRLRKSGIPFRFCSNTSKESTDLLRKRLVEIGFEVQSRSDGDGGENREEIWTSIGAVGRVAKDMKLKRPYFLLSNSAQKELSSALELPSEDQNQAPFDSVIVGLAPGMFSYNHLNTAFRILIGEHHHDLPSQSPPPNSSNVTQPSRLVPLIATHKAKYIQSSSPAGLSLGPGPFVTALEHASGLNAHVVGKPTKGFFQTVIGDFTPDELGKGGTGDEGTHRIAVIGDDIEADLGEGAIELGLWRVLVRTGKYRTGDESKPGVTPPDEVCDSFAAFIDSLIEGQSERL